MKTVTLFALTVTIGCQLALADSFVFQPILGLDYAPLVRVGQVNDLGQVAITVFPGEPYAPAVWSPSGVTLPSGFPYCAPVQDCDAAGVALNNQGQLVGTINTQPPATPYSYRDAYFYSSGVWTNIESPAYGKYGAYPQNVDFKALNQSGQIVATYGHLYEVHGDPMNVQIAFDGSFLWQNDSAQKIIDPRGALGSSTVVSSINDAGEIVGYYKDSLGVAHGFVDRGGAFSTIDFPGARSTELSLINDPGQIVGNYIDSTGTSREFLYTNGKFLTLSLPAPYTITGVTAINNHGEIVGDTLNGDFIYQNGAYQFLNMNIVSLNNEGDIATFDNQNLSGFIGYPVNAAPEPQTLGFFALGCAVLVFFKCRRRRCTPAGME